MSRALATSFVILFCFASTRPANAQSEQRTDPAVQSSEAAVQLLKALLGEVKQLRSALQQSTVAQHKSSLILERIRRQQDLIDILEAQRDDLRDQIAEFAADGRYEEEIDGIKEYDTEIAETNDPRERAELVQEQARLKRSLERKKKADAEQLERFKLRVAETEKKIQSEQATLIDLRYQLQLLERDLERQSADSEKHQASKP